jgi:hypothetical protein
MDEPKLEIRYGNFIDIDGPVRTFGEVKIVPAKIELNGICFIPSHRLEDHLAKHGLTGEVKALVRPGEDAPWVRGRAQHLFHIPNRTEEDRPEKSFFWAGFIAILPGDDSAFFGVPFECNDYYGRSALIFSSENAPPEAVQDQIAEAFWGLLLSEPHDLAELRDTAYHYGTGKIMEFGVENGEPFVLERDEEE